MKLLRRRIRINAEGRELYRFINALHDEEVACFGQYCRKDVFYGEIYRRDLGTVRELAEECGVSLKEAEYRSVSELLSRYRKRFGIVVGLAAALCICVYFSQVVVTIEVRGNVSVSESALLSAVGELGIKRGKLIRSLDLHYCENELGIMVDGISKAFIRRSGNRIVVEVTEVVKKPEMLNERVPCNIISAKDAEITSVSVYDGMLMHKVGDYVPAGTLLISGVAEDDTGHTSIHHANGEILGIYSETASFDGDYCPERYVPTGETRKERYLRLFSIDIPLFFGKNGFKTFEHEWSGKKLIVFGKSLPIAVMTDEIAETRLSDERYSDEELEKMLTEKMYLYEKNFLSECRIIERKISRKKGAESFTLTADYRLEGNICEQRDIFFK